MPETPPSETAKRYEGKAKILYATEDESVLLTVFKDDATAFNALKRGQITGKGQMNCTIAAALFKYLATQGIPTHFITQTAPDQMTVKALQIIPVEVVVRNIAAGSLCRQTGLELGTILPQPLVEFYYKNDDLQDPLLTRDRLLLLNLATPSQVEELAQMALQINQYLTTFFKRCNVTLVDFKLEFGLDPQGMLYLADEISPDTCRLWDDSETDPERRVMDKDRFRQDLGGVAAAYQTVQERVLQAIAQFS
ncbi:MAG: phosphoribosylaminoimidazolesuccinocarboxamide synthase [Spirulina sp. SIO3F2]|nr:phosphoribosylaminoimidazolesuccinocarboxamide synthase [Spirulina sp. SIO3F2]